MHRTTGNACQTNNYRVNTVENIKLIVDYSQKRTLQYLVVIHLAKNGHFPIGFLRELARHQKSLFALNLTKEAVNVAEDALGRVQSMQSSFALHQLTHTHWLERYGVLLDPTGLLPEMAKAIGAKLKRKEV